MDIKHDPEKDNVNGVDTQKNTKWLINKIGKDEVFIECGAHVGFVSVPVILEKRPSLSILIEPHHGSVELLERNLRANGCTNYGVIEALATGHCGYEWYYEMDNPPHSSMVHSYGPEKRVKKKAVTIDSIVRKYKIKKPIWMKVDVELAEELVWRGIDKSAHLIKGMVMELMPGAIATKMKVDVRKFLESIQSKGFEIYDHEDKPLDIDALRSPSLSKVDICLINVNENMGSSR